MLVAWGLGSSTVCKAGPLPARVPTQDAHHGRGYGNGSVVAKQTGCPLLLCMGGLRAFWVEFILWSMRAAHVSFAQWAVHMLVS